jgi:hypothetical protein
MWFVPDKSDVHEGRMVVLANYCAGNNKQVRTWRQQFPPKASPSYRTTGVHDPETIAMTRCIF